MQNPKKSAASRNSQERSHSPHFIIHHPGVERVWTRADAANRYSAPTILARTAYINAQHFQLLNVHLHPRSLQPAHCPHCPHKSER
eukprot:4449032-Amphidinium_carterae.1